MKKITLILALTFFALSNFSVQGQNASREKYLNAGIGVGAFTAGGIPIGVSLEVGIKDNISVGGFFDYARYGYNFGGYKWRYNFLYFGARGSYHFGDLLQLTNEKLDPYAGVSLGVRTASYSDNDGAGSFNSPYSSGVITGLHAGAHYYLNDNLGGFAEVGYGVAALRLGITLKF
jgi:hypothetical protein